MEVRLGRSGGVVLDQQGRGEGGGSGSGEVKEWNERVGLGLGLQHIHSPSFVPFCL